MGVNNRTCHPALHVHVIIGGEAPKQVNYITNNPRGLAHYLLRDGRKTHYFKVIMN